MPEDVAVHSWLSAGFGTASMVIWILVYFPQLHKSFKQKSVEGVSLAWLILWLLGDATNCIGAFLVGGVIFQIIIAAYYVVMDLVLLYQYTIYNEKSESIESEVKMVMKFVFPIFILIVILRLYGSGSSLGTMLGWISAMLYLSSRTPQIVKNFRARATGDLSVYLFVMAIFGNLTYAGSVLAFSTQVQYLMKQAPWLLGSAGTVMLDGVVVLQFWMYKDGEPPLDSKLGRESSKSYEQLGP
uniref:Uncharacterized protein n=1 Tax=Eutreptiella gymnastica TaxID=73025 RepID=A0A7S4CZ91_9EUGL